MFKTFLSNTSIRFIVSSISITWIYELFFPDLGSCYSYFCSCSFREADKLSIFQLYRILWESKLISVGQLLQVSLTFLLKVMELRVGLLGGEVLGEGARVEEGELFVQNFQFLGFEVGSMLEAFPFLLQAMKFSLQALQFVGEMFSGNFTLPSSTFFHLLQLMPKNLQLIFQPASCLFGIRSQFLIQNLPLHFPLALRLGDREMRTDVPKLGELQIAQHPSNFCLQILLILVLLILNKGAGMLFKSLTMPLFHPMFQFEQIFSHMIFHLRETFCYHFLSFDLFHSSLLFFMLLFVFLFFSNVFQLLLNLMDVLLHLSNFIALFYALFLHLSLLLQLLLQVHYFVRHLFCCLELLSYFFEDCCLLEEVSEGLVLVVHPVEVGLQQRETVRMFFMLHIEVIITFMVIQIKIIHFQQ